MLKAIYETKRQALLLAYSTPSTSATVGKARAFAYSERMCPVFHSHHSPHEGVLDPFDGAYEIPRAFVTEVLDYCDNQWLEKNVPTFYDLEEKYDRGKRMALYSILRYAFLSDKFDEDFYTTILSRCPTEAKSIASSSVPFEVHL